MASPRPNIIPTTATTIPIGDRLMVTVVTSGPTQSIRVLAPKGVADMPVEQWRELVNWMNNILYKAEDDAES